MIQSTYRHALATCVAVCLALGGTAAVGEPLPVPSGTVLLTVTGDIEQKNSDDAAIFDLAMLQDMNPVEFETSTIWTDGVQSFTGVPLSVLLQELGITSGTLRATAINDYAIELPVDSVEDEAPIIAFHMNGNPMSRREKGPLWIVYPYDSNGKFRSEVIYSRSIWQLDRLEAVQ